MVMKMTAQAKHDFLSNIESSSHQELSNCYQCLKCTVGCPVSHNADYNVNQIVRLIQMNQSEKVLQSSMIWLCAACETCGTRCPNSINMAPVMDVLKQLALEDEENNIKEKEISAFHSVFLKNIRSNGRIHEMGMMGRLKLKTGGIFSDMGLAYDMMKKGKLKILPHKIKGIRQIKQIFREKIGRIK